MNLTTTSTRAESRRSEQPEPAAEPRRRNTDSPRESAPASQEQDDTSSTVDRRGDAQERRQTGMDRRNGLERRRGPGRRRSDSRRSAEEGEMSDEQFEFVMAIDEYKRVNRRPFPSWTEVLEIIKYLGYRKVAPMGEHLDRLASGDESAPDGAEQS